MNSTTLKEQAYRISELRNPFMADCVIKFMTWCYKRSFSEVWIYTGTIEFQNGNTKGEQRFEATDFASLLKKMETFMSELERS